MLSFYKRHFFLHKHVRMHSCTRLCRGVTVDSFGPSCPGAKMITERSDPETKTLFMLLANIG